MKKLILLTVVLIGLSLVGCSDTSMKTPEGTIQLLFKHVKAGKEADKMPISNYDTVIHMLLTYNLDNPN